MPSYPRQKYIPTEYVAPQSFTDEITIVREGVSYKVRPTVDLTTVPGTAIVGMEVFVPGFGWLSTGFGGHRQ